MYIASIKAQDRLYGATQTGQWRPWLNIGLRCFIHCLSYSLHSHPAFSSLPYLPMNAKGLAPINVDKRGQETDQAVGCSCRRVALSRSWTFSIHLPCNKSTFNLVALHSKRFKPKSITLAGSKLV